MSEPPPAAPADAPETPAEAGAPESPTRPWPQPKLTSIQAKVLLICLTVYVVVLAALTADQVFEWGLIRPELDRQILARIETFGRPLPNMPTEALRRIVARAEALKGQVAPELGAVREQIQGLAEGFLIGAPPDAAALDGIDKRLTALSRERRLKPQAAKIAALTKMAAELRKLEADLPAETRKALAEYAKDDVNFVINYHEFSIPHLIRALRKGDPARKAAAAYCLKQIARQFFNYRGPEEQDPDAWQRWWRAKEAELERRSKR